MNKTPTPTPLSNPAGWIHLVRSRKRAAIQIMATFGLLLSTALADEPTGNAQDDVRSVPLIERLPGDTIFYFEVGDSASIDGTRALELWQEEELQDFLEPALSGIREDVMYGLRDVQEELRSKLLDIGMPTPTRFALLRLAFEAGGDLDELMDIEFALECELGADASTLFDSTLKYLDKARRDGEIEDAEIEETTVSGRPAIVMRNNGATGRIVLDGERWLMQFAMRRSENPDDSPPGQTAEGGVDPEDLFGTPEDSLASRAEFTTVRQNVAGESSLLFAWMDAGALREWIDAAYSVDGDREPDSDRTRRAEATRRLVVESPGFACTKSFGYGIVAEGGALRDRIYLHAPGPREGWAIERPLGDAPARHAALAAADADLLFTLHFDAQDWIARTEGERERIHTIQEETGADIEIDPDVFGQVREAIMDAAGIDIKTELLPVIGHYVSVFLAVPPQTMQVPDAGLVVDLADGPALDALMDDLLERDSEIAAIRFTVQEIAGLRAVSLQLVDSGLPIIPTICRRGDQLLITTMPQSMKSLLRAIDAGETLAQNEDHAAAIAASRPEASALLWCDLGAVFEYLYGFVGLGLSAARMSGATLGERFDGALLPSGDMLAQYLGHATFQVVADSAGMTFEGRSTVGNPMLGMVSGVTSIATLMLVSESTRDSANAERTKESRENLRELANAMEAYRGSVGGGNYPRDLVKLFDSGLLTEAERLVDPRDPKPRRVRSGTGGRIPISYAVGSTDLLPEDDRPKGESLRMLYTRGAWHDRRFGGGGRLAIVLGGGRVLHVNEDEWAN